MPVPLEAAGAMSRASRFRAAPAPFLEGHWAVSQGERWGNYLLEERVGAGGMAEVFRARRVGAAAFSKLVCVKRLHTHLTSDKTFVELFLDEARTGAKLRHKNIVGIDDLGEHEGRYFLAMEFVNGVDLSEVEKRLRATGTTVHADAVAFLAGELLAALHAAHSAVDPDDGHPLRIVHRDVSPHNVLVSYAGEVKLTDFGIARAERRVSVTSEATVRGRFGYMPVEQASGKALDARADLFALGVVLFELLTGRRPFRGDDPDAPMEAILVAQITNERPSLASLRSDVPAQLAQLVEWLLATDVSQRPPSAAAALAHLETLPARLTGGPALAALMGALYPSQASTAHAPRASWSGSQVAITPSASVPPRVSSVAPGPAASTPAPWIGGPSASGAGAAVDPYAATDRKREPMAARPIEVEPPRKSPLGLVLAGSVTVGLLSAGALFWARSQRGTGGAVTPSSASVSSGIPALPSVPREGVLPSSVLASARPVEVTPSASAPAVPSVARVASPRVPPVRVPSVVPSVTPSARSAVTASASVSPAPSVAATAAPEAPPAQGTLRVIAFPWGEVFIDGQPRGRAPVNARVPVGEHSVRITGGVEHTERVQVEAGRAAVVRAGDAAE